MRPQNGDRVLVGVITARTAEEASLADDLTYTVEVDDNGLAMMFTGVKPGHGYRVTDMPGMDQLTPPLKLYPFFIGQEVPVSVRVAGNEDRMSIMTGEFPQMTPCEDINAP